MTGSDWVLYLGHSDVKNFSTSSDLTILFETFLSSLFRGPHDDMSRRPAEVSCSKRLPCVGVVVLVERGCVVGGKPLTDRKHTSLDLSRERRQASAINGIELMSVPYGVPCVCHQG
jgi:hypothetical protein